ncbi:BURP domain protein USPL1-like [Mercurialis annua]|uniref:BURP domain protein USPL1-like n=1 Tax=Mercurialis annua TaxID=3986 RepID=UPI002160920D|nr:BURP domain protein USPL1-like [Mercurialis annua]
MKVIFIVLALLSLHWLAFKLDAAKDLRETVPNGGEGITSQNDFQSNSKTPVLSEYQNSGNSEQEKSPLNDSQPEPNPLDIWKSQNGVDGEKEKIPQNYNFQPEPNQLFFWRYQNGADGEKVKILQNHNFQPEPNQLFFWRYQNGADGEKVKILQNHNFQPEPNQLFFWKYQNGADGEKVKILQNHNFQPEPNQLFFWRYQNGADGEKVKILQNHNFQPESNQLFFWKYQNRGNDIIRLPSMKKDGDDNPPFITFFTKNDLKAGNKLPINLRPFDRSSKDPPLLSKKQAESYPFSYKQFEHLLHLFSVEPKSPQAQAMDEALKYCEAEPLRIETKFCATSFEAMLDLLTRTFGLDSKNLKAISTMHLTKPKNKVQNYTITEEPKELATPKLIACHIMPYPYIVFYCHSIEHTKGFRVSLVGENGDAIETIAVCHSDTSEWSPEHVAFREVGGKPGSTEVCHFSPSGHLLWIPLQA